MGLFEKSNAAGNVEGNVAARQLELQFQRVKMGTIKHGYIIQADTLIAQLERALGHESGLLTRVTANHERRLRSGLSVRDKLFDELMHVGRNGRIGDCENFRRAPIIGLDLIDLGFGITLWKFEDVLEIRAAPRVNALGIVADHHQIVVAIRQ